jgi:hypothetical protein
MNIWKAQNFPFLTQLLFYENGTEYDQLRILNSDYTLNYDKLAEEVTFLDSYFSSCLRLFQGLPWYAASQLLYKISRTMYIGGEFEDIKQNKAPSQFFFASCRNPLLSLA